MSSETEIIIAFIFNRSGKSKLSFSNLYLTLSMELNWFTPDDAKDFVNMALNQKLLIKKDRMIQPDFDYTKIVIPVGFAPSKKVLEVKEVERQDENDEDILNKIVKRLVNKTDYNDQQIIKKINELADEKKIIKEVAALLISKEYDIPMEDFFEEVEKIIFRENV